MYKDTDKQECAAKRALKLRERAVNTAFEQLCYTFIVGHSVSPGYVYKFSSGRLV